MSSTHTQKNSPGFSLVLVSQSGTCDLSDTLLTQTKAKPDHQPAGNVILADQVLANFSVTGQVIQCMLPEGCTLLEALSSLALKAQQTGLQYPILVEDFFLRNVEFWIQNAQDPLVGMEPGKCYQFIVRRDSGHLTQSEQLAKYGQAAPLAAMALAEACQLLTKGYQHSLFGRDAKGEGQVVRGGLDYITMGSMIGYAPYGVHIDFCLYEAEDAGPLFCELVPTTA
ncbi:MAG: hypothetical protein KDD62_09800 [Bdellovibrionales bacterium]|nr:hypothetical protein [Bdellovibrionales bacterium]